MPFVKDPKRLWLTWTQAKQFRRSPSEILGLTDQPMAYYFDRAVFTFGRALEAELEQAAESRGKTKKTASQVAMARQTVMARWLKLQRFADPVPRR